MTKTQSLWVAFCLCAVVVTDVRAQDVAKGRQVFSLACVQCHGPSHTTIQRKPATGWRKTVYTMISRGAPVLPGETEALVAYLTSAYGPTSTAQPIPAGGEFVAASCGTCHPAAVVFGSRKSESDWQATIKRMRSQGANITDTQEKEILDYLVKTLAAQ
jgi:mono/diheme cytochrome c family protein